MSASTIPTTSDAAAPTADFVGRDTLAVVTGQPVASERATQPDARDVELEHAARPKRRGVVIVDHHGQRRRPGEVGANVTTGEVISDPPHQVAVPPMFRRGAGRRSNFTRDSDTDATGTVPLDLIATAVDDRMELTPDRTGMITGCMSCCCLGVIAVVAGLAATRRLQADPVLMLVPLAIISLFFCAGFVFRSEWLVIERGNGADGVVQVRRSVLWSIGHDCGKPVYHATRRDVARTLRVREDEKAEREMQRAASGETEVKGLVEARVGVHLVVLFRGTEPEAAAEAGHWRGFLLQYDDDEHNNEAPTAIDINSNATGVGGGDGGGGGANLYRRATLDDDRGQGAAVSPRE